jgi:hypothetical protein
MPGRNFQRRVDLTERLATRKPRKLLAIDGGGIRGVLSLSVRGSRAVPRRLSRLAFYNNCVARILILLVPLAGLEPARGCHHLILSQVSRVPAGLIASNC